MKYYIIAGEASGDLHASSLISEIRKLDSKASFRCWGGDLMEMHGAEIVKHYRELAFMGFLEVITNLRTIIKNIQFCKQDLLEHQPDVLILVDYPGFNLRIAEFAHQHKIKVVYYISPQIWAWKKSRVFKIKRDVDKMLVILPFEKEFYQQFNYKVYFVGHPLLDAITKADRFKTDFRARNSLTDKKIIALLPGSRKQEISVMLPLMLKASESFKEYQVIIAGAPSVPETFYRQFQIGKAILILNQTYEILQQTHVALVTSGTATLETALFDVPEVVCYKGNSLSYQIAKQLIKVKYISLVNLIMDRVVVKELIQNDFHFNALQLELEQLLTNEEYRNAMILQFRELKEKLGGTGASHRAAVHIYNWATS